VLLERHRAALQTRLAEDEHRLAQVEALNRARRRQAHSGLSAPVTAATIVFDPPARATSRKPSDW